MTKYLIIETIPYEGPDFDSIESDKNLKDLTEEFNNLFDNIPYYGSFVFCGKTFYKYNSKNPFEIVSLDSFWEQYR